MNATPDNTPIMPVVVIISGNGSNLQAIMDFQQHGHYQVVKVISNRPDAFGLVRAQSQHIATQVVDHTDYPTRTDFEQALIDAIDSAQPKLIVLAGFMRVLTSEFTQYYAGKVMNIHPSLLPKYPGLNTHQRALDSGDSLHGLSIHFVTDELDGGPVILQAKTQISADDSRETLQNKVHQLEYATYPQVIELFALGEISYQNHQVYYQNQPLSHPLEFNVEQGIVFDQTTN